MTETQNTSNNDKNPDNQTQSSGHATSDNLYLAKLEFRPELRKTWLNFFVSNFRVVALLIALLTLWGVSSFLRLPRESNPEVKIPIAVVSTVYPGVSPADMEELVTKKIETGISGLKGITKITSNSRNSVSAVTVEFDAKENLDDSLRKLRDQVNSIKKDLPADANEPNVIEISFDDAPIWTIAIIGPYDGFTLRKYADDLATELEKIPDAREVNVSGGDQLEFEVAYDPQKLTLLNITTDQANQAVKAANLAIPAGTFEGKAYTYPVRADSRFFDAKTLGNTPIMHADDGAIVYLKDIASVKEKAIKRTVYSRLSIKGENPQEAVTISIVKKTGGSVVAAVEQAIKTTDSYISKLPAGVEYDTIVDNAKRINLDFNQLTHDFTLTLALVFGILFLFVGLKEALVAGLAVPLVFFVTFGVMVATGITLNFLSIFSLILSLGLLVDDAIVVVSATKQYLRSGKFTPEEAVLLVLNDFKVVLTTTTLTTVWAFLPLLSSTGIIGSFIKSIPITVSVTLIASLFIALMINHPLAAVLERIRLTKNLFFILLALIFVAAGMLIYFTSAISVILGAVLITAGFYLVRWYRVFGSAKLKANAELMEKEWDDDELIKNKLRGHGSKKEANFLDRLLHGIINFNSILPVYEKYLCYLTCSKKRRIATLAATSALFISAVLLPILGVVPSEFFPASNEDIMFINIEAPVGLKLSETSKIVAKAEERLLKYPEIVNFSTIVGAASAGSSLGSGSSNSHLASITVNLKEKEQRKIMSYELADLIRKDLSAINEANITVEAPRGGPPSGSAFEARISGDDLKSLDKIAKDLKPFLSSITGVLNTNISLKESPAEYTFTLNPARMELYNLNSAYVGSSLRLAISGIELTTVIRGGDETKVIARFAENKIPTLEAVQNLQILNLRKQPVFLKDVAKIELKPSVDTITRIDQKRVVLLSSDVDAKTRPNEVLAQFQDKVANGYKLPEGYSIFYGGENEQNAESVQSIIRAMAVAGLLIISTLVIQFNSFKKALIVLVTIPLALIGVFFGMALTGVNLSFPGLIGILALFGIVVKNAIILIDKINLNLKSGIEFDSAVVDAGKSRLEAIFITSICTIIGIIPITLSNPTWLALGSVVIFGLMLSSFLTLFIVPTLFMSFIGKKERF
jgi:multidrug efflux pump subunit AcrB